MATPARTGGWEAAGPRPLADLLESGLLQRVVTVDVHTEAIEGFLGIPLEHVSTVPMLMEYVRPRVGADRAVVPPDMGWRPDIPVVASHGLFADPAEEDLRDAPVERYVAADSVPLPERLDVPLVMLSLARLLADAIDRLPNDRSLHELLEYT